MGNHIVIVGAGQAGLQAAETLRAEKYNGLITLLGDEPHTPYHRPPLSKDALKEKHFDALTMRGQNVFERRKITMRTGCRVSAIHPERQTVELDTGESLSYSGLLLATGASPRLFPGQEPNAKTIHVLRSRGHSEAVAERLSLCQSRQEPVVVIGGGFIGLEVAAVAREMGLEVTVLEAGNQLMGRVATPVLAKTFQQRHESRGVHIALNARVTHLSEADDHATIELADGQRLTAGLVVVAIGVTPNDTLAQEAGIVCNNGIVVDAYGRTSAPHVFAAGDCAARSNGNGHFLRLESIQNAIEQGKAAARSILGQSRPFHDTPYFWSDQFDMKLQIAGVAHAVTTSVVRGNTCDAAFSIYNYADERLVSVDTLNAPKEHILARKMLSQEVWPTPEQASDPNFDLAALMES
ncbi:NAD(P)/FAD-dependent oxidoreductase [Neopusillimonas maritima]|uniref:Pyridine nucleotide-disulfide oxidoreductase n=1 Tax=Neopusillimonas maritima TaxID=2026239 RepID=A0ABX9MWK2_9BURK|nr:FAD-dependent oxidoreductase [Neopusillimonas maritima]RII83355.1 pyridine nucleotide-disulfide oxidoreductase [Neopusillimonas maritima]